MGQSQPCPVPAPHGAPVTPPPSWGRVGSACELSSPAALGEGLTGTGPAMGLSAHTPGRWGLHSPAPLDHTSPSRQDTQAQLVSRGEAGKPTAPPRQGQRGTAGSLPATSREVSPDEATCRDETGRESAEASGHCPVLAGSLSGLVWDVRGPATCLPVRDCRWPLPGVGDREQASPL